MDNFDPLTKSDWQKIPSYRATVELQNNLSPTVGEGLVPFLTRPNPKPIKWQSFFEKPRAVGWALPTRCTK